MDDYVTDDHVDNDYIAETHSLTDKARTPRTLSLKSLDILHKHDFAKGRLTLPLAITAGVAAFGNSFPHGWNTGVLNAPSQLIQDFLNETYTARVGHIPDIGLLNILWATTVSIYLVGGCAGAFAAGWMADKFGRRNALLLCHAFGFMGAILFGLCKIAGSFEMFILARLLVGFGCGAGSGLVPMYLTEISPVNIRGAMGVVHQVALTLGILFSQIFGLREILGSRELWPLLLASTAIPCAVSLFAMPWFPDSPRYLLVNKDNEKAAEIALKRFRGVDDVTADIAEMRMEQQQQKQEPRWTFSQLLKSPRLRLPLILVCSLATCQQLSGINVVFYYSTSVFLGAGISMEHTQYAVLGTGLINVIMTVISVPLMEKSGRRPLLLIGMIVMVVMSVIITISLTLGDRLHWMAYISLICVAGFIIGFAIGLGSIPQFIGAELFKQGPRPPAMSLAGFLNWLANFVIGITFPSIQSLLGARSFLPFVVTVSLFVVFLWWRLPETKNKSYDEIYDMFKGSGSLNNSYDEEKLKVTGDRLAHPISLKAESDSLLKLKVPPSEGAGHPSDVQTLVLPGRNPTHNAI